MKFISVIGPAGSGKSTLTGELASQMEVYGHVVARLNFDPAAEKIPYDVDVDVRDYVSVQEFMERGLGPNAALISAVDSLISHVSSIRERLEEVKPDYVIVDTPGQMELFAYRHGGPIVLEALYQDSPSLTVFLIDAMFLENPVGTVSALALASSVALRIRKPQINIVTKADLLRPEILEEYIPRLGEEGFLTSLISADSGLDAYTRDLTLRLSEALYEAGFIGEVIPVSVIMPDTLQALHSKIVQVLEGGEEYKYYDIVRG